MRVSRDTRSGVVPPGLTTLLSMSAAVHPQVVDTDSITRSSLPKFRMLNSLRRVLFWAALPKSNDSGSTRIRGPAVAFLAPLSCATTRLASKPDNKANPKVFTMSSLPTAPGPSGGWR